MVFFPVIKDLATEIRYATRYRYGFVESRDDQFSCIQFRPWPKLISSTEALWVGGWKHRQQTGNRCRIYFNQPVSHSNYLTVAYIESTLGSTMANLRRALQVLDIVAMTKRSDAVLCQLSNKRISDRMMLRQGWERHLLNSKQRHWIKRFYGDYCDVESQLVTQDHPGQKPCTE